MKSTVVDESLSSYKPMYCSREYQTSTRWFFYFLDYITQAEFSETQLKAERKKEQPGYQDLKPTLNLLTPYLEMKHIYVYFTPFYLFK